MTKQILVGTTNPTRIRIVRAALAPLAVKIRTLADLALTLNVEENGQSTQENAQIKAGAYFAVAHIPTLAIDGGLHIEQLPSERQPGTLVKRMNNASREMTPPEMVAYYQQELAKVGGQSAATWEGSMALVISNDRIVTDTYWFQTIMTAKIKGTIRDGAPLDVISIDPTTGKYYSDMSWEERKQVPDIACIGSFVKRYLDQL